MKSFNYDELRRKTKHFINKVVCFGNDTKEFSKTDLAHKMFFKIIVSVWVFGSIFSLIYSPCKTTKYTQSSSESFSDVQIEDTPTKVKSEETCTNTSSSKVITDSENVDENSITSDNTNNSSQEKWWEKRNYDEYGNLIPPPKLGRIQSA